MSELLIPPPAQILDQPGTIRWAVGKEAGPRSQTWSVIGQTDAHGADNVFVGIRDHMRVSKLSLHAGKWRLAFTKEAAAEHLLPGVDRVISRWEKPIDVAEGWKHAACIVILVSSLGSAYPEKRVKRGGEIAWFPATRPGTGLRFDVMIGKSEREDLTVEGSIGEVGRMTTRSGGSVWVVGTEFNTTPDYEQAIADVRAAARAGAATDVPLRGWAWGSITDSGVPLLLDLSTVTAARALPQPPD